MALSGGFGTIEELMEMTTCKQLGIHNKGVVIFNVEVCWDPPNYLLVWPTLICHSMLLEISIEELPPKQATRSSKLENAVAHFNTSAIAPRDVAQLLVQ